MGKWQPAKKLTWTASVGETSTTSGTTPWDRINDIFSTEFTKLMVTIKQITVAKLEQIVILATAVILAYKLLKEEMNL